MEHTNIESPEFSEDEWLLQEIQEQCSLFADELMTLVCKRAIRVINTWPTNVISGADDYPNRFSTYDILCCEHQSKNWNEMNPLLEDSVIGTLSKAYGSLSPKDKFFVEYSEFYYNIRFLDIAEIEKKTLREIPRTRQLSL